MPPQPPLNSLPGEHRVLLVEDHLMVRAGLAALINAQPDIQVYAEAADASSAKDVLTRLELDLAIIDLGLKNSAGLDLIKTLRLQQITIPILVLSMYEESLYAERVLRVGAQGYIMKEEATTDLLLAIREVLQGGIYVSPQMRAKLLSQAVGGASQAEDTPLDRLSDRELEVFQLLGQGYNRGQIADALHISVKTVEAHRSQLRKKLHLNNSAELARYALSWAHQLAGSSYQ